MEKDKTRIFLDKYNYNFAEKDNSIIVQLEFSQQIKIEFDKPNKIVFNDKLVGWNFLTGMIEMNLKNALVWNFVGTIILGILCLVVENIINGLNIIPLFLIFITWIVLFTGFYNIKLENFKTRLINWTKEQ